MHCIDVSGRFSASDASASSDTEYTSTTRDWLPVMIPMFFEAAWPFPHHARRLSSEGFAVWNGSHFMLGTLPVHGMTWNPRAASFRAVASRSTTALRCYRRRNERGRD